MESKYVGPRNVDVWLPPGYFDDPTARYPVVYMHDGQNLFDPATAYGSVEWQIDETMGRLLASREIRPAIVVGVWNTSRRWAEYMPKKAYDMATEAQRNEANMRFAGVPVSDGYLRFLVEELKPAIDRAYRTRTDRADTAVMGSSMGGLISLYAICEYPNVFGAAGCVSTHWPAGDGVVVEYLRKTAPDPATHRIWFDYGTETLDALYEPYQERADQVMRSAGFVDGRNWTTRKYPGEEHSERSWSKRADVVLKFLLAT